MSCQTHPYLHADGTVYADAESCSGCCLNRSPDCDGWKKARKRKHGTKMPARYRQKERERKRAEDIAFARRLGPGYISRHEEDPEGSAAWVETGIWPEPDHALCASTNPKEEK